MEIFGDKNAIKNQFVRRALRFDYQYFSTVKHGITNMYSGTAGKCEK